MRAPTTRRRSNRAVDAGADPSTATVEEKAERSAHLAMTLASMDQGILVLDAGMDIRIWNQRTIDLLRLPEDFIHAGTPMADVLRYVGLRAGRTPEQQEKRTAELLADFRRDRSVTLYDLNPDKRVIERRSRPMPDGGTVTTFTDVTALTERERLLEEKGRLLAATLSNMDQGILVFDDDLTMLAWNERVVRIFNVPQDYFRVGLTAHELIRDLVVRSGRSAEDAERIARSRADGFRRRDLVVLSGADVAGRIVERKSRPLASGGYVVIYTDVTERRRQEEKVAEKSTQLSATLDNMDQGLIVIDRDDRITLWNDRVIQMFDLPFGLVDTGRPFAAFIRHFIVTRGIPAARIDEEVANRMTDLRKNSVSAIDHNWSDGRVFERRSRAMADGGFVMTYTDVTERRRAEGELKRAREEAETASRTKNEFMANISHELRTPLNAIIGFSDVLAQEVFGPLGNRRYVEYAQDVRESGAHLLSLINDVLDIAKVEVNMVELREEPVDCGDVINSCMRLVRERAKTGEVALLTALDPNLPCLRGDERRLKQIVLNLLSNAVKFTPRGGKVELRADANETGFRLIVADTGIGIAEADIERAMTPFGQIDSRLARRYEGTGLGLPLARSMTELHGGTLTIASTPSLGTTVTVWFPPDRIFLRDPQN